MKIHQLKIEKQHYDDLMSGKKKAELRFNDRDYAVGDLLFFKGIALPDGNVKPFTFSIFKSVEVFYVTHIIDNPTYLQPGYVMMSIMKLSIDYHGNLLNIYIPSELKRYENNKLIKHWVKTLNWID